MRKLIIGCLTVLFVLGSLTACKSAENTPDAKTNSLMPPQTQESNDIISKNSSSTSNISSIENISNEQIEALTDYVEKFIYSFGPNREYSDAEFTSADQLDNLAILYFCLDRIYEQTKENQSEIQTDNDGYYLVPVKNVTKTVEKLFGLKDFIYTEDYIDADKQYYRYYPAHGFMILNFKVNPPKKIENDVLSYVVDFYEVEDIYQTNPIAQFEYTFYIKYDDKKDDYYLQVKEGMLLNKGTD
ncbi:hypothetical protein EDD70_2860 [Hydrogenoanaerobacterium saccharovorans]|uniref:Uncharacterized protein n=1 Tax=Hydrogenoanaerobacterium saccharovorans TaxID=474960 RepID=A0A1H8E3H0_9FIRM|nr:hypothetical protein [Hydrogenoanaerobacterium saccharovorans]RPF42117.1 hypothetical protein EDD70_2860 [Hydrogenoanaerobacterium saccharovorans]SEN14022.1 hypothetical protein SAMN05216180_2876 [Hydrogenoanaerobacterium saccharovorans]